MQGGQQAAAEVVAADTPRHAHIGAQPGRGHRLVGALPAGREPGRRAEHGRAGFGQPGHGDGDIHVQAAQHGDPRMVSHARTLARPRTAPSAAGAVRRIGPGNWLCRRAARPSTLGVCLVSSARWTSSPILRISATRSPSCSARTGSPPSRCSWSPAGRTCRRPRSCWRRGPARELPFAGHPTLGTCHAWLEAGGRPADPGAVVQECEAGLITVRRGPGGDAGLAFAAPPLVRGGPVEEAVAERVARTLSIARSDITDIAWADNGPGWIAVLLASAEAVLAVQRPVTLDLDIGVTGPYPAG